MSNDNEPAKIKLAFVNEEDEKLTEQQELIKKMEREFLFLTQSLTYTAKLTRAKYNALISEGFKAEEALELCKKLF